MRWPARRPQPGGAPGAPGPVVEAWCADQTRYWEHAYAGPRDFTEGFRRMNEETSTVFLFEFEADRVDLRPKSREPWSGSHKGVEYDVGAARSQLYLDLFRRLVAAGMRLRATVAVETHDMELYGDEAPVFCFQKQVSSRKMLLPDIDFFHHDWYQAGFVEPPWRDKRPAAGFAGSSTGGGLLTREDVSTSRPQRLQWALSALGRPAVDVFICDAVQCDSDETAELLRAQPYFRAHMPWPEQLAYRYLISMDGNGATCSRVVNTLRSGSVLLKSPSPHQLYYFGGLKPFEHYVPIDNLNDVEQAIADGESGRLDALAIVAAANRFHDAHLTRPAVERYTRLLLERYAERVLRAP